MSLITVSSLSKSFGADDLFAGVSFTVAKGARLALVGPNGIGKTTLLRILIGQEEPSGGTVTRARSLRIGYLSQEADFALQGVLWDVRLEPFADLIRMQGELEKLEAEMSDSHKREQALVRYGSVHMGFPRRIAEQLVLQTIKGSASFYEAAARHPATLRNQVTSPGGTSAEALYYLEKAGFRTAISRAVWAAYQRSLELGKEKPGHIDTHDEEEK